MTHHLDHHAHFSKIDVTIKKIRNVLQKQLNEAGFDITVDQWVVIEAVQEHPGITQNQLADLTSKDPPTITRIIDLLQNKGLVARSPTTGDRRKYNLYLTDKGNTIFLKASPVVAEVRRKGWGGLDESDYQNFIRIMDSIFNNFT